MPIPNITDRQERQFHKSTIPTAMCMHFFWLHCRQSFDIKTSAFAEVVELVDTLGSGSSGRRAVGVRVSPSAPIKSKG